MANPRTSGRTFLGGKILWNDGRSTVDCIVRSLSEGGSYLEVESPVGLPERFLLQIADENEVLRCRQTSASGKKIGFDILMKPAVSARPLPQPSSEETSPHLLRGELLKLKAALDEVDFGVVLLDNELRAQFINRAFRTIWRLPDQKADSKPAFVALMYHGRDTRAYDVPLRDLDAYVAERVAAIRAGDPKPRDLRLADGQAFRLQCAVLPNGGRMLSYVPVTDIVRQADELILLRAAMRKVQDGIILLDADMRAQFINDTASRLWKLDEIRRETPHFADIVKVAQENGAYGLEPNEIQSFIAGRVALVQAGDNVPRDLVTSEGRHIRSHCSVLPNGGRLLTYCDITDLVETSGKLNYFATVDSMTEVYNRRHFLELGKAEFERFQRYQRPLSLLMIDIDHFKSVNDRFGHATGDLALREVARICAEDRRKVDMVGRLGGEEFAILLPETNETQAQLLAERIRQKIEKTNIEAENLSLRLTVSIGIAAASLSMSGVPALLLAADKALYKAKADGRNRVELHLRTAPQPDLRAAE